MTKQTRSYEQLEKELDEAYQKINDLQRNEHKENNNKNQLLEKQLNKTKEKLKKTQRKYQQLLKYAPTGIYELDFVNRSFLNVNDAMIEYTGYSEKELLSMDPMDLLTDSSKKKFQSRLQKAAKGKHLPESIEYELKTKQGNIFWTLINVKFIKKQGRVKSAFVIAHDITHRKKLENQQTQLNMLFDTIIQKAPIGIAYLDKNLHFQIINETLTDINGISRETHVGKHIKEVIPDLYPKVKKIVNQILQTGQPIKNIELKGETPSKHGIIRQWNESWYPIWNKSREITGFGAIVEEITERKHIEKKLAENEQRLREAEQTALMGNVEYNVKHKKIYWSDMVYTLYERDPILGPPSYDEIIRLHTPQAATRLKEKVTNAITKGEPYEVDLKAILPSGKTKYFHSIGKPIKDNHGEVIKIKGIIQDITNRKQIEKKLSDREERLRLSQKAAGVISWDLNLNTNEIVWLGETKQIFGDLSKEKINSLDRFITRVHPDDRNFLTTVLNKSISNKEEFWIEHRIVHPDGKLCWVQISGNIQTDRQGKPKRMLGITHDITKEKNWESLQEQLYEDIEKERDLLNVIMENTHAHLAYLDPDFNFITVNSAYAENSGYNQEELIGKNHFDLFPNEENEKIFKQVLETKQKKEFKAKTFQNSSQNKETYWNWTLNPILDKKENVIGLVLSLMNVTEMKETEEKIRSLNESLMKRTTDLSIANNELEAFTYSASHDLRAPLRSINGFSEILLEDYQDQLDEEGKDYLQRICKSAKRMSQLINDLLKLSRISRAELKQTTVDFSKLAQKVVDELKQREPDRNIRINIEPNMTVTGDRNLLRIVLKNLIENAWKFTKNTSDPKIDIGKTTENNQTHYYVKDNGAGFDNQYADKLFTPFQRLHDEQTYPGTGIGLPLVARIIHRHNGQISGKGQKGKGAVFSFTIHPYSSSN